MALCYSALQKSLRVCDLKATNYWSHQIGDLYPNALRKRLCQNSLEDACGLKFSLDLLKKTKKTKPTFEELKPYVYSLTNAPKTHISAWLNRVAADHLYNNLPTSPSGSEIERAAHSLNLHSEGKDKELTFLWGDDIMRLYKYTNCDPLVFMSSILISEKRPELKSIQNLQFGTLQEPEKCEVLDYYNDKHTKIGKKMGRGYDHFLSNIVLSNPVYRSNAEPYRTKAEELYREFRIDGKGELRVKHVLEVIRNRKVMGSESTTTTTTTSKNVSKNVSEVKLDVNVFKVNDSTVGLGFKNATFVCDVVVGGNEKGEGVKRKFIKIGETGEDLKFAVQSSMFREELGVKSLKSEVVRVKVSREIDYGGIASKGKGGEKWRLGVERKVDKAKDENGVVEALVVDVFEEAIRMSDLRKEDEMWWSEELGEELLKVLMFRKWVGSKDTNAFNLMVRELTEGSKKKLEVLSVDEGKAGGERLKDGLGKGLETAQKIKGELLEKCADALVEKSDEIGLFLKKMNDLWKSKFSSTTLGSNSRMEETHRRMLREWGDGKNAKSVCRKWLGVEVGKKRKIEEKGEKKIKRTKT
ncbi:hypothetical protein TrLO_g363 [Triparma laevis f. longispina]|uniref:Uncharacterized protein n=1 Tax=Triparma laevis f. longispina TaxID=1714387 RepID=A0A9W7CJL3_9STRA|nr:hypothetical protein TrLO_g363 [Triparma laevis f. longispina]